MNETHYSMLIEWSDEDQAYIVSFPEWEAAGLIGHTHGVTYTEAVQQAEDMLRFLLESAKTDGDPIPQPRHFAASAK